jgi:hypothetical protein
MEQVCKKPKGLHGAGRWIRKSFESESNKARPLKINAGPCFLRGGFLLTSPLTGNVLLEPTLFLLFQTQ